jgi:hypothetical protein
MSVSLDGIDGLTDDIVRNAVRCAARRPIYSGDSLLEAHLVRSVQSQLEQDKRASGVRRERHYTLRDWTRSPGGVDLTVETEAGRVLMEMKVGKPQESLWDAIKLADILAAHGGHAASYLVYDGGGAGWGPNLDCSDLFRDCDEESVEKLIQRWPKAWMYLMLGGNGIRPRVSIGHLGVSVVSAESLVDHPNHELKALRVSPIGRETVEYDIEGWPTGYHPPREMRERIRIADEARGTGGASIAAAESNDPCHRYPWYRRWNQSKLDALVPTLKEAAYECLRKRLQNERNWTERQLRERVDPLRTSAK